MLKKPLLVIAATTGLLFAACGGGSEDVQAAASATATQNPPETETTSPSAATAALTGPTERPTTAPDPTVTPARPTEATVSGAGTCLNIRAEPTTIATILDCAAEGSVLNIWGGIEYISFGLDWLAVETEEGEQGWASAGLPLLRPGRFPG